MLELAREAKPEGDLILLDIGQGLPFRAGTFDYVVSISVIQWLCTAEKSAHNPIRRLKKFFDDLYKVCKIGARLALQFYPENPEQLELITTSAIAAGFSGGVVVDYPNSAKAKKYFLFLQAGFSKESLNEVISAMPKGLNETDDLEQVKYLNDLREARKHRYKKKKNQKLAVKSKLWVMKRKERRANKGLDDRHESKYTGRKRPNRIK